MAIANNNEEKPLIIYTFKKLCNGEQWLATQHYILLQSCSSTTLSVKVASKFGAISNFEVKSKTYDLYAILLLLI